jgi:hypothetical protein
MVVASAPRQENKRSKAPPRRGVGIAFFAQIAKAPFDFLNSGKRIQNFWDEKKICA